MEPTTDTVARSYDAVPYDAGAIAGAHPDALAVVGRLWGMVPPPVETCRVLELGCSTGENLLALAVALPAAEFHGIDASPAQIETGRARLDDLGITNVRLECRRIEALGEEQPYDYVLCHGVYSWVPQPVREQILARTAALLAPNGLAYLSYNTQPGWHMRQQLRNLLLFHMHEQAGGAHERIAQVRALLSFVTEALRDRTDAFGMLLREEARTLNERPAAYLFHEFMEAVNEPVLFSDFVAGAARHGLQYVDDVRPLPDTLIAPAVRQRLADAGADRIALEQYVDFLAGRAFRRSVLCRAGVRLEQPPPESTFASLRIAAAVKAERDHAELTSDATETFHFGRARVQSNHPAMKVALSLLGGAWPRSIAFPELRAMVASRLQHAGVQVMDDMTEVLAGWLQQCHRGRLVDLHAWLPPFTLEPGNRPRASALARWEAAHGLTIATTLRHTSVALHPFDVAVLARLDGETSRDALVAGTADTTPPADGADSAADAVERALDRLARCALLLE
jgi:SAM-dependent methyltransferase